MLKEIDFFIEFGFSWIEYFSVEHETAKTTTEETMVTPPRGNIAYNSLETLKDLCSTVFQSRVEVSTFYS